MLVTNQTDADYWFGPLHLPAGVGQQITVDDTSATSLYLTSDSVADAINNLYASGKITVSSAAQPFPRPTGTPSLLHGDGWPEGLVYAPQGSIYLRRDGVLTNGGVLYVKTTGITVNTGWLDLATASGATAALPTGAIMSFGGSAAPDGFLLCDGSAVSRETYSTLFGVIGTTYGAGDGTTTFNVPNLKGRVPAGLDGTQTEFDALGKTGGEKTHELTTAEMPSHDHGGTTGSQSANHTHSGTTGTDSPDHTHSSRSGGQPGGGGPYITAEDAIGGGSTTSGGASARHTHSFTTGINSVGHTHTVAAQGGGGSHNNLQPYLTVGYIIKT